MSPAKPLLQPVPWPPLWRPGKDKFVPVIKGRERALFCIYVVAPEHERNPVQIGYAHNATQFDEHPQATDHILSLGRRLHAIRKYERYRHRHHLDRCRRGLPSRPPSPHSEPKLFWAAWFEAQTRAHREAVETIERSVHDRLREHRCDYDGDADRQHYTGAKWFAVDPETARATIEAVATEAGIKFWTHERYLAACRWRSTLDLECRIPRSRAERELQRTRMTSAARLALDVWQYGSILDDDGDRLPRRPWP